MLGRVAFFSPEKGFGFLRRKDGGPDVFVHYSAIQMEGYKSLEANDIVEFDVGPGSNGKTQAENVVLVKKAGE